MPNPYAPSYNGSGYYDPTKSSDEQPGSPPPYGQPGQGGASQTQYPHQAGNAGLPTGPSSSAQGMPGPVVGGGPYSPVPTGTSTTTTPEVAGLGGGGGGGKAGGGGGSLSWDGFHFAPVPLFHAPTFKAPTAEEALNEPGYKFRLGSGEDALQRSAAAKGVLRTGGTLKDILEYGQNFASNEYAGVYDRALKTFGTQYQGAKDEFAPYMAQWQNSVAAERARGLAYLQAALAKQYGSGGGGAGGPSIGEILSAMGGQPAYPTF